MQLTEVEYAVIQVIIKFPEMVFGKKSCSLYESNKQGMTMNMAIRQVLDWYEVSTRVDVYLKELESRQYVLNNHGVWQFTSLCPCGRTCKYVNRNHEKKGIYNPEGQRLNYVREIISGKELNFTDMGQPLVLIAAKPVIDMERPVRSKQSKKRKPKTNSAVAKAWNEGTYMIQKKEQFLAKIANLEARLKEIS